MLQIKRQTMEFPKRSILTEDPLHGQLTKVAARSNLNDGLISPYKCRSPQQFKGFSAGSPVKSGRLLQGNAAGLKGWENSSFEHNQSFPLIRPRPAPENHLSFISPLKMDKIRGDSLNSCRFSAGRRRCSFSSIRPVSEAQSGVLDHLLSSEATTAASPASATLCASLSLTNSLPQPHYKSVMLNPNKAVFTFDFKTMQILVVNQMACRLLGFSPEELCGLTLSRLLNRQHAHTANALAEEHLDTAHGTTLGVSGKVVEMISKDGNIIPVSLWLRRLETDDRCLAVAEPVERRIARMEVDANGRILWMDKDATQLFQYRPEEVEGEDVTLLIPALLMPAHPDNLPKEVRKQKATGRTKHGTAFPLCLRLSEQLGDGSGDASVAAVTYSIVVWVFSNMSGLVVLKSDGTIDQCNHHFCHIMFGYTQAQLVDKHISTIIPNFGSDVECIGVGDDTVLPPFQLGEELAEAALNTDSTTPHVWRSSDNSGNTSMNPLDTESRSTNILSLDQSNNSDCVRLVSSVSQLTDITNKLNLHDDDTTSAGVTLQNDMSPVKPYRIFSSSSSTHFESGKENQSNQSPNEDSDQLVTADGTTCEDFSRSEDDTLNGNQDTGSCAMKDRLHSPVSIELSACICTTTSTMCTCTSHPSRYDRSEVDDDTVSAPSLSYAKPPAPTPVPIVMENYAQGHFMGFGKHRDASNIEIVYQVRLVQLGCGRQLYCVWISGDHEEDDDPQLANLTFTSSLDSSAIEQSLGQEVRSKALSASNLSTLSMLTQCEDELVQGEYGERYTTLQQIGKGAYGYVKMAYRNDDKMLVITKFIHKKKVHQQSWVEDPTLGRKVPLEVSLLTTIKHPNIVQVVDVLENESFFQMVMEKHGAGMDLFEFVDRRPKLDEPLTSYIFRQIVAAVDYLHSLQILHRDIKDENVIIDQHFHAKLIDFGSATFMSSDRLFSTFYGTVEYCSPEVLAGNKYEGPELEIWSLGVTLYVLTFGENPFFDVEETLRAELRPPSTASSQLLDLLHTMLDRDPTHRCTMRELSSHEWINQPVDSSSYRFQDVVSCLPHEHSPPIFYDELHQGRPPSGAGAGIGAESQGVLLTPVAHAEAGDEDEDRTDLATSNSLSSLTPVDELGDGLLETTELKPKLLSDKNFGPSSSTPLKRKSSRSANSMDSQASPTEISVSSGPHVTTESSSSSISPASSSSCMSGERSSSSVAFSMNRKENDSQAQNLLDDCSERLLSYAGAPVSPVIWKSGGGGSLTDEEEYLNDNFEDVKSVDNDGDSSSDEGEEYDDDNDVNCASGDEATRSEPLIEK